MNKAIAITAVVSTVAGGVLGGALTYLTVNKALRTRYEDWANEQIDQVKARYAAINEDTKRDFLEQAYNPGPAIRKAVEEGKELLKEYVSKDDEELVHPTAQTLSIWDQGVPDPDIDPEDEVDEPEGLLAGYEIIDGEPHLISEEEYFENEDEYELDTLTYFAMDDVLVDNNNERIENVEQTIGVRHLTMFPAVKGDDKRSLYIKNDDHDSYYEVILVEQSYAVVILGMTEEEAGLVEPKPRLKKMKRDDD